MMVTNRRRILLKLEVLWDAHPDDTFGDVLLTAISRYAPYDNTLGYFTPDSEVEGALDGALKAEGLSVTGGWKS